MAKTTPRPTTEAVADEMDGLLGTAEVERITGYGRRWLAELVKQEKFPKPDVPGRLGAANRWRRSTIRRYLDGLTMPSQPSA